MRRFAVPGEAEEYLYVDSVPGLVALAQAGILEIHPWNSRASQLEQPDQVIFDLDPDEALPFSRVAAAARRVRALLAERGLESFVKTTGGKGLHVCVPLEPERGWEELEDFTRAVAQRLARDEPGTLHREHGQVAPEGEGLRRLPAQRAGRQRGRRLLHARPRRRAGLRSPWAGTSSTGSRVPTDFTVAEVPLRVLGWSLGRAADPWARYRKVKQRVPASLTRDLAV